MSSPKTSFEQKQKRYSSKSYALFISSSYQCTISPAYLNLNTFLQILLVYLTSFLLSVDVTCGNKENCNPEQHITVSEWTQFASFCDFLACEFPLVSIAKVVYSKNKLIWFYQKLEKELRATSNTDYKGQ